MGLGVGAVVSSSVASSSIAPDEIVDEYDNVSVGDMDAAVPRSSVFANMAPLLEFGSTVNAQRRGSAIRRLDTIIGEDVQEMHV